MDKVERPTGGITPFLFIANERANEALTFYEKAFAATVIERNPAPDGKRLMQASMKLNGGWVMIADEFPEYVTNPSRPPSAVTLHLQVNDADAWFARAIAAGATVTMPLADQFWGDRYGQLIDPFGHEWSIGATLHAVAP